MMTSPALYLALILLPKETLAFVPAASTGIFPTLRGKSHPATTISGQYQTSLTLIEPPTAIDLAVSAETLLDGTSTKLLISVGLTVAAIAGSLLVDQSANGNEPSFNESLDAKYSDPDQLKAEYRAREEALQLAMEREAELALAEERGEYNKTRADAMMSWKLAEGGSDPAGIQSSLPQEEERKVRQMIAEQQRMEEEGAFCEEAIAGDSTLENQSLANGEEDITKVGLSADLLAASTASFEFAAAEEDEATRTADLKKEQNMLELMAQSRQTEVNQLQCLMEQQQTVDMRDDERTNLELNEAMELASSAPTIVESQPTEQIFEVERAVQADMKMAAIAEQAREKERQRLIEAEKAQEAERQKAAEIARAQIQRDMAMVREYNEERKAKAAEAVAAADLKQTEMTATININNAPPKPTISGNVAETDVPGGITVSEDEEKMVEEGALTKGRRKRDKVARFFKNKKVIGAGLAYIVGKKLLNVFFL